MGGRLTAELPFVDQHAIEVEAGRQELWRALIGTFGGSGSRMFTSYATLIGVDPRGDEGEFDQVGSTRTGFRVTAADPPEMLHLTGNHRFSSYSLTWEITEIDRENSRLLATTRAEFPGLHGRAYKAAVIDSGIHARVTKRMLRSVARRA